MSSEGALQALSLKYRQGHEGTFTQRMKQLSGAGPDTRFLYKHMDRMYLNTVIFF